MEDPVVFGVPGGEEFEIDLEGEPIL